MQLKFIVCKLIHFLLMAHIASVPSALCVRRHARRMLPFSLSHANTCVKHRSPARLADRKQSLSQWDRKPANNLCGNRGSVISFFLPWLWTAMHHGHFEVSKQEHTHTDTHTNAHTYTHLPLLGTDTMSDRIKQQ